MLGLDLAMPHHEECTKLRDQIDDVRGVNPNRVHFFSRSLVVVHAKNRFAANPGLQRTAKKWPIGTFPISHGKSETTFVWAKFKSSLVKWSQNLNRESGRHCFTTFALSEGKILLKSSIGGLPDV